MRGYSKYRAVRTPCNQGHKHASKREAARCDELHLLQRAGEIINLSVEHQFWFVIDGKQVKHPNGRRVGYKTDFAYTIPKGLRDVAEDVKSSATMTEAARLRLTLFQHLFPEIELRVVK